MKQTEKTFTCERCGTDFTSTAHHARYCKDCRKIIQKERVKREKQYRIGDIGICAGCGKEFIITSPSQRYCSDACKPKRRSSPAQVAESRRKNFDTVTFYMPKGSRAHLQEACDRFGTNLSDLVRAALFAYLEEHSPDTIEKIESLD